MRHGAASKLDAGKTDTKGESGQVLRRIPPRRLRGWSVTPPRFRPGRSPKGEVREGLQAWLGRHASAPGSARDDWERGSKRGAPPGAECGLRYVRYMRASSCRKVAWAVPWPV